MKTTNHLSPKLYVSLVLGFLMISQFSYAQKGAYTNAMKKALTAMDEAMATLEEEGGVDRLAAVSNQFERIAAKENQEWLPVYYDAYVHVIMSFKLGEGKLQDASLDVAQELLDKATAMNGDKSELMALQGMLYIGRIVVKPMLRGMTYSGKVSKAIEKSISFNEDNPRAYYVLGQLYQGMPKFAGGGMDRACPEFNTAKEKFATHEMPSEIHPTWGKKELKMWLARCEGN